ncbi:hypothetical protein CDD83_2815 [Cordyceps sp. RAO-2017]|nr:hypothetical protein CDD83_2815 [Cordyceps sp. RAO-2017]
MAEAFVLPSENLGLGRIDASPAGSSDVIRSLLQRNHEKWHMYFRDVAGHNHIPHAVLTTLAMGGGPQELRRAYDDGEAIQRPMPPLDPVVVSELSDPAKFRQHMQVLDKYPSFLAFFEHEIEAKGSWQAVINEHCFRRTPLADFMLAQLFEGLYHPIIHLGFGIEFELPGIVAEGLAQAASHDPMYIDVFFQKAEELARQAGPPRRPLVELYREVRANDKIRTAARLPDGPWKVRDGVLGRAMEDIVRVAAQFQVEPTDRDVERATAEMISCAAWTCGGVQKPGKERKIDFFLMHNVTSSIFLTVMGRQPWIRLKDKARLIEYKARMDLVWYAASAAPEILDENILNYEPTTSKGMDWGKLYETMNRHHDDGHVAKFVRAIKNGEEVTLPFEKGQVKGTDEDRIDGTTDFLPVRGDMWFRIAQMCYDSVHTYVDGKKKWVWGAGFDPMWDAVRDSSNMN